MDALKILHHEAQIQFKPFSPSISLSDGKLCIDFLNSGLFWKGAPLNLEDLPLSKGLSITIIAKSKLTVEAGSIPLSNSLNKTKKLFEDIRELLLKENIDLDYWKSIPHPYPTGFKEGSLENTKALLDSLYKNDRVVAEKKAFVVDLNKSQGAYLVADEKDSPAIYDAASQIASIAIGHNHRSRNSMALRPELLNQDLDLDTWDIAQAFKRIVREQSNLEHVYFCNSGAESMELAVQSCQSQYPTRRKIVAFEGSFHGRTLLALHSTFNPVKRIPFQIYNDLVEFMPFPEDKTPDIEKNEPSDWLSFWKMSADSNFQELAQKLLSSSDELLKQEIDCLLKIRESLLREPALCLLIEPMQCEGGDRYATPRFFRALRVLTKTLDCALVMDEVQTGFGLGKSFFWHKDFNLPEAPDALFQAKKSQTAFCATRFELKNFKQEACPASIHRGYIQAVEILEADSDETKTRVKKFLDQFQNFIGDDIIQSPRNQGYAFAFDLPSKEIVTAFVKERFTNGLLFYPAGDLTARFRLLLNTPDSDLYKVFRNLILCLQGIQEKGIISKEIPSIQKWDDLFPEFSAKWNKATKDNSKRAKFPWPEKIENTNVEDWENEFGGSWDKTFQKLVMNFPQSLVQLGNSPFEPCEKPKSFETFLNHYKTTPLFTKFDLLLESSRFLGTQVVKVGREEIKSYASCIDELQVNTYEKERQTLSPEFIKDAENPKTIILLALESDKKLLGICAAAPASLFKSVHRLGDDGFCESDDNLYSFDLTIAKAAQGKGIGFKLKAEQLIAGFAQNSKQIKSRNRYPESKSMSRLNFRLGHAAILKESGQYGVNATALYQSFSFTNPTDDTLRIGDSRQASLKNKITLSNFVTHDYCKNFEIISELYPKKLQHFYLSSGRAETSDKMIRLLRNKRPKAIEALSVKGSFFGETTAVARSLGGPWPHKYFAWPTLEKAKELEQYFETHSPELVLGIFASFKKNSTPEHFEALNAFSKVCKDKNIPLITASETLPHESIDCDAHLTFGKGQLGVIAVTKELFFDKPLQMISTWEGDEWSLSQFKNQLMREL